MTRKKPMDAPRALVAMSGGVDSAVAALCLVEAGYDVSGVTLRLVSVDAELGATNEGCPPGLTSFSAGNHDLEDARQICAQLGIGHITLEAQTGFRSSVIEPFCESYLSGETPNPCIACNRTMKFGLLQRYRKEHGFDFLATGHYVQRCQDRESGLWSLTRGVDPKKDQSYVLYFLAQDDLAHTLFPLGGLNKTEVRVEAHKAGFSIAEKKESQDICFIPQGDYASFIESLRDDDRAKMLFEPGSIVDREGHELGRHRGLIHYTLGQRKGIGIAKPENLMVYDKDLASNTLIVAPRDAIRISEISARDFHLIYGEYPKVFAAVTIKTSYRGDLVEGAVEVGTDHRAFIRFCEPQPRPAPGQSVVIYDGDKVLGGGIIDR